MGFQYWLHFLSCILLMQILCVCMFFCAYLSYALFLLCFNCFKQQFCKLFSLIYIYINEIKQKKRNKYIYIYIYIYVRLFLMVVTSHADFRYCLIVRCILSLFCICFTDTSLFQATDFCRIEIRDKTKLRKH